MHRKLATAMALGFLLEAAAGPGVGVSAQPISFQDATGRPIVLNGPAQRVVTIPIPPTAK
jgi:ABC-type Fe3+-hydroxamate transport system substrate-binding protein